MGSLSAARIYTRHKFATERRPYHLNTPLSTWKLPLLESDYKSSENFTISLIHVEAFLTSVSMIQDISRLFLVSIDS
jgi:hypothetical protein